MKKSRLATMVRTINGRFTIWRKGTRVRAGFVKGVGWCIERIKWRKPKMPLFNSCICIPRSALKLDPK